MVGGVGNGLGVWEWLGEVVGGWGVGGVGRERERDLVEEKPQGQPKQKEEKRVNQLLTVKG